jgi:16S rRNA C967 or C1407 C5-methylase (RsmB/RsmF family)
MEYPAHFSAAFAAYCAANGIAPEMFAAAAAVPRYLRVAPSLAAQFLRTGGGGGDGDGDGDGDGGGDGDGDGADDGVERLRQHIADAVGESHRSRSAAADDAAPLDVQMVPWLPRGWCAAVPRDTVGVASCPLHQSAALTAMDAASYAAVVALRPARSSSVLDVCCAPGMKLGLLCDACPAGLVVGVDASLRRLYATRALLEKRGARRCRVYLADGTAFSAAAVAAAEAKAAEEGGGRKAVDERSCKPPDASTVRKRRNRALVKVAAALDALGAKRGREGLDAVDVDDDDNDDDGALSGMAQVAAALRATGPTLVHASTDAAALPLPPLYDAVLIDAECTHDGSIAHVIPAGGAGGGGPRSDTGRMHCSGADAESLWRLQAALLENGFRQLRRGGCVVYSTCSFARRQNEDVVAAFLARHGAAAAAAPVFEAAHEGDDVAACVALSPAECARLNAGVERCVDSDGAAMQCVRVTPQRMHTSFQFIAKIKKL